MTASQVGWLSCLLQSYENEHDWDDDPDADSTSEMIAESRAIVADLKLEVDRNGLTTWDEATLDVLLIPHDECDDANEPQYCPSSEEEALSMEITPALESVLANQCRPGESAL